MTNKNKSARAGQKAEQFWLPLDLANQLRELSEKSGLDKTEIAVAALRRQMLAGVKDILKERLEKVASINFSKNDLSELEEGAENDVSDAESERKSRKRGHKSAQ